MPAHAQTSTANTTKDPVTFRPGQVGVILVWFLVGVVTLVASFFADRAHAHILWPLMTWATWLATGVGGLGWILYGRVMAAIVAGTNATTGRQQQIIDTLDGVQRIVEDMAVLRGQVTTAQEKLDEILAARMEQAIKAGPQLVAIPGQGNHHQGAGA